MAASTSTAADSNNSTCYDVFISHRGPDVKKTFASHLYRRLISCGLRVFLDYRELEEGEDFPSQIKADISAASLHVAIFSPTYADSQWCLDELVLMLESGTPIIPVFHHVKPTELRRTDGEGVYAESLRNLEKKKRKSDSQPRYDSETIENWRNALSRVANITGLDLEAFNGDEGDLVEEIVEVVFRKGVKTPLTVARYPTGLADKVQDFETKVLLQQCSGRVQILGITGLGGVGKTTLALELFNRKRSNYRNSYFLSNVRENAKKSLHSLQSQLLKGLFQLDLHIENRHAGFSELKKRLSSRKVLLVLDDVDHQDQVFALLPQLNDVQHDSLILITSRDKDVLRRSGVQESSIYLLSSLNTKRSRELFCSHAFCNPHPLPGFEYLVDEFLKACKGLPLSLKVFGGLLCGNTDKSSWKDELDELRKALPHDIRKSLQISYDALKIEEQQIFLDIACFFIGIDRHTAISVWDGSGWNGKRGFESLLNKCLVEVEVSMEDNYDPVYDSQAPAVKMQHVIRMHDHLRDMGRNLANSSGLPCRLWCGTKHMEDLLQQSSEATKVRGIRMFAREHYDERSYTDEDDECADTDEDDERASFSRYKMKNLEILDFDGGDDDLLKCLLEGVDSPNLLWFRLRNCFCFSLPPYIPMAKLRVLDVEGDQWETLWEEDLQAPSQLRELRISVDRLVKIPKSIRKLKRLERMVLESQCDVEIPEEFCYLRSLKHLVLRVELLSSLPDSFGNLPKLKRIDLSHCAHLESLPDSFGNLSTLERINLSHCIRLKSLPESFGKLSTLKDIDLIYCSGLESLPDSFGNLSSLERINLSHCICLKSLPESFGNLLMLEYIDLSNCNGMGMLPKSFGNLSRLKDIDLCSCNGMETLPDSFGNLSRLEYIDLSDCCALESLPESFGNLSMLECIDLSFCAGLKRLPDSFGNLSMLKFITLFGCNGMERLPDSFGNLSKLDGLSLYSCYSLTTLPDSFGNLTKLGYLSLTGCDKLTIPGGTFREIKIDPEYMNFPEWRIEVLPLQIAPQWSPKEFLLYLINLTEWPSAIGEAGHLEKLVLETPFLEALPPSFGNDLRNLKCLELRSCRSLKRLPDSFLLLNQLIDLTVIGCSPELPPSSGCDLRNLKFLELRSCRSLKCLPDSILLLNQLIHLRVEDCSPELPPSFGNDLRNLKCLELRSCRSLKRLPDSFLLLNQLVDLRVEGCSPELHFKAVEGENETLTDSGGERTSSNLEMCLLRLRHLTLLNTHISEVSFPTCVFPDLQYVDISDCPDLVEVTLPNALIKLNLYKCSKLRKIGASFPPAACPNLQDLHIMKCEDLVEGTLPNAPEELPHYDEYWAEFHDEDWAESMPIQYPQSLAEVVTSQHGLAIKVEISDFSKLRKIGGSFPTGVCPNFQDLSIQHCDNLVELEILPTALQHLNIRKCEELVEVDCPNLQPLEIWPVDCQELVEDERLPNGHIKLQLIDCPKLNGCSFTKPAQRSGGRSRESFPKV